MAEEYVFQAEGLCFGYGETPVIDGLSVDLKAGRFYSIVGPNGSGKTTLLDLLTGYRAPSVGKVLFLGRDVADYSRREFARQAALVPQEYAIQFPFRVEDVVLMGRHPHIGRFSGPSAGDREAVQRAMEAIGIHDLRDRMVTELSGGEKQRVVLARALAQEAGVLLLDEPTSQLDVRHALRMLDVAASLAAQGRTVIAVMHDLNLAATYSQAMVFLKQGRVFAAGPTAEVLTGENVGQVFGVDARVDTDPFTQARRVSLRRKEAA